ncbi:MAG: hypothetical protein GEV03_03770 [Streptosporangiales bacterium]|nr:hypothetical protein [Streptosporangiales bacterium]
MTSIPPLRGFDGLIPVLDDFAASRPSHGSGPTVVLTGEPGEEITRVVAGYRERLIGPSGENLVPHVLVEDRYFTRPSAPGATSDLMALDMLDDIADRFQDTMPAGSGELRLPLFRTCRAALAKDEPRRPKRPDLAVRRKEMVEYLYYQLFERHAPLKWLAELAGPGMLAGDKLHQRAIGLLVRELPRAIYGLWLTRTRRLSWATSVVRGPAKDFLSVAVNRASLDPTVVRRILLMALLKDLDRATRPFVLSKNRHRREWSFVVLLPGPAEDGTPARRLLDTYGRLDLERQRTSALMILATIPVPGRLPSYVVPVGFNPRNPPRPGDTDYRRVANDLRAAVERSPGRSGSRPVHGVCLEATQDEGVRDWLNENWLEPRPNRRRDYSRPVVAVFAPAVAAAVLMVAILEWAGIAPVPVWPGSADCRVETVMTSGDASLQPSRERVGITNGDPSCTLDRPGERRLRSLEALIHKQNEEVIRLSKEGNNPYRTVVFFAPLTLPADPGHIGPSSLLQLRGAVLAQRQANNAAQLDPNKMRIRLLIANPGDRFGHWQTAADRIIELARSDRTLGAIIGISQSRNESIRAIRYLHEQDVQLPIIGSAVTGDAVSTASRDYFQISPRNHRIADAMAVFAHHKLGSGAVVVFDPGDYYSRNLRNDFKADYARTHGRKAILDEIEYSEDSSDPASDVASDICGTLDQAEGFVYFAGRAQQFPALLYGMRDRPECQGQQITVLGGSALTVFVADPNSRLGDYPFLTLYYGAFSDPISAGGNTATPFVTAFRQMFGQEPESDAAAGYDALRTAAAAINRAYTDRGRDPDFDPTVAAEKLRGGEVNLQGETGYIAFDRTYRAPKDKRVLILEASDSAPGAGTVEMDCGQVSREEDKTTWGQQGRSYPCPRVDY